VKEASEIRSRSNSILCDQIKRIRVLFLMNDSYLGPAWTVHQMIISHGREHGIESVVLLDTNCEGPVGVDDTVPVFRMPLRGLGLFRSLRRIRALIREHHIDVVHVNDAGAPAIAAALIHLTTGTPFILHHHCVPSLWNPVRVAMLRGIGAMTTANVAVSEFQASEIHRHVHIPRRKLTWVVNRVDTTRFSPDVDGSDMRRELGFSEEAIAVIELARIWQMKRQHILVRAVAIARCSDPRIEVALVGWDEPRYNGRFPSYRHELRALAEELGIAKAVHIHDSRPEAPQLHAAADIFCLPSVEDPCPLVVLEAKATGRPFVGVRSGGTPSLVQNGNDGLLVSPDDPEELAAALVRLAADEGLRRAMGERARARAVAEFDEATFATDVAAIYRTALAGQPLPAGR
jgi:glycosyltransferase involved in cell wall biosynthesis